jgi:hypothetical protein
MPRPSRYHGPTPIPQRVNQPAPPAFFLFSSTTYSASKASTNSVHRRDNDEFNYTSLVPTPIRLPPPPRRNSQQNLPICPDFRHSHRTSPRIPHGLWAPIHRQISGHPERALLAIQLPKACLQATTRGNRGPRNPIQLRHFHPKRRVRKDSGTHFLRLRR